MYAVIESGGKQYRVQPGDFVQVEKIPGDQGSSVTLNQVLMFSQGGETAQIQLGKPHLAGATVQAEIVGQGRGEKILIVKMKRRKQYRRTQGHRQEYTQLLITEVANGAGVKQTLAADEKKTKLGKFQSHLKAKGPASTPKTLGSRVRMKKAAAEKAKASKSA